MNTSFLTELLPIAWELSRDTASTCLGDFPFFPLGQRHLCHNGTNHTLAQKFSVGLWLVGWFGFFVVLGIFWLVYFFGFQLSCFGVLFALDSHKENTVLIPFLLGAGGSQALFFFIFYGTHQQYQAMYHKEPFWNSKVVFKCELLIKIPVASFFF